MSIPEPKRPLALVLAVLIPAAAAFAQVPDPEAGDATRHGDADINAFFRAISADPDVATAALGEIARSWRDGYTPMLVELVRLVGPAGRERLFVFLEEQTDQDFGSDLDTWKRWMWALPYDPHPLYDAFKGAVYGQIDPRMAAFFPALLLTTIRLDEVEWGGVSVNGIPPLDYPARVSATDADYLADTDIVFGIALNGEAMAYPKRILGWHEMARDRIGGIELTVIYCTLCGTVLPYESEVGGELRRFGTSGLLYRSNKLFFDEQTASLWSTLEGRPVIGRLAGQDLRLRSRSSVTTTWGEWKRTHPDTEVLSIQTGYDRDYSEGAVYRDYFATDALMFQVSETDDRLQNKDEVLVMRLARADARETEHPWAISTAFLERNRLLPFEAAGRSFLVVTSPDGANRVFETGSVPFAASVGSEDIVDENRTGVGRHRKRARSRRRLRAFTSQSHREPSFLVRLVRAVPRNRADLLAERPGVMSGLTPASVRSEPCASAPDPRGRDAHALAVAGLRLNPTSRSGFRRGAWRRRRCPGDGTPDPSSARRRRNPASGHRDS